MKSVLVLFGSTSDSYIYDPLVELFKNSFTVDIAVLSAHRNPTELEARLAQEDYDYIVAGAGIAAHLPGVVASKVPCPVFGIPVGSYFEGVDAFFSVVQMPYGVPVLSCTPDRFQDHYAFMHLLTQKNLPSLSINIVADESLKQTAHFVQELKRLHDLLDSKNIAWAESNQLTPDAYNIQLVGNKASMQTSDDCLTINSYILDNDAKKSREAALTFFNDAVAAQGLWVGCNNTRNGLLFIEKCHATLA